MIRCNFLYYKKNIFLALPADSLRGIWEIVSDVGAGNKGELEFDLDTLPVRKLRELEMYVR